MFDFTDDQLHRYSRNILLKEIGIEGQAKLRRSRVLVAGAGGLGSPVAVYLAAAGVGHIGVVDDDQVDVTNLQRQILHATADVGRSKAGSAAETMRALNPDISVEPLIVRLCADNVLEVIAGYDFVVDGTDNFSTKFLLNDACVISSVPFSHGGVLEFTGQAMTVLPGKSACYRCVFPGPPPAGSVATCSEAGVLGSVAGMLGTIQATEVIKFLTGSGRLLIDSLLCFDALAMHFRTLSLPRRRDCPVCGAEPSIIRPFDYIEEGCPVR